MRQKLDDGGSLGRVLEVQHDVAKIQHLSRCQLSSVDETNATHAKVLGAEARPDVSREGEGIVSVSHVPPEAFLRIEHLLRCVCRLRPRNNRPIHDWRRLWDGNLVQRDTMRLMRLTFGNDGDPPSHPQYSSPCGA